MLVLCELVWVLRGAYHYEKRLVVKVLDQILVTAELEVENEDVARQALSAYREGPADFPDYVIAYANCAAGCETTYSFDQKLTKHGRAREP